MPEEYKILLDAYKEGVLPDLETLENFNRMLEEKSVKYGESIATKEEYQEQNKNVKDTIKKVQKAIKTEKSPWSKADRANMSFMWERIWNYESQIPY